MTDKELIEAVAVEVMGFEIIEKNYPESYKGDINNVEFWLIDPKLISISHTGYLMDYDKFNPLTDSNHTDMLRDKLADMRCQIREVILLPQQFEITIKDKSQNHLTYKFCEDRKDINKTRTKAYLEAFRKLKQNNQTS